MDLKEQVGERRMGSGLRVAAKRNEMGITQKVLATRAKCSHAYISMWEWGKRVPSNTIAKKVSKVLEIDFDVLLRDIQQERHERRWLYATERSYARELSETVLSPKGQQIIVCLREAKLIVRKHFPEGMFLKNKLAAELHIASLLYESGMGKMKEETTILEEVKTQWQT